MSLKRVKDAAFLSSLAHLDAKSIEKRLPERGYEFIKFITIGSVECYIAFDKSNQKDQVLVFRETENWKS